MNKMLRQLFVAVIVLFTILGLSSSIITAIRANELNADPRNVRALYHEYGTQRGFILTSDGTIMAKSDATNDAFKFQRSYPNGPLYAPVTGYFSISQRADRGIEASRNSLLSGESDSLFWQRIKSVLTGSEAKGATIETSIDSKLQNAAYQALGSQSGAAVAMEVKTGRILAMVSTPSYDPNELTSHNNKTLNENYARLTQSASSPMVNNVTSQLFPPGSTFKTVVAAAALESGKYDTNTQIPAGASYTLPGTVTQLTNVEWQANGSNGKISLEDGSRLLFQHGVRPAGCKPRSGGDRRTGHQAWFRQFGCDRRHVVDRLADEGHRFGVPLVHDRRQACSGIHRAGRCDRNAVAERDDRLGHRQRRQAYAPHAGGSRTRQ